MNWYQLMINNLPVLYRTKNTLARYKVIAKQFEELEKMLEYFKYINVIDLCTEEQLMDLASNVQLYKVESDTIEVFRELVKIEYYKTFIIPTHNNIKKVIKKTSGLYPSLIPLWTLGDKLENDHGYSINYDVPLDFEQKILDSAENIIGAGIKIAREYAVKLDGNNYLQASLLLNHRKIIIGGENGI